MTMSLVKAAVEAVRPDIAHFEWGFDWTGSAKKAERVNVKQ